MIRIDLRANIPIEDQIKSQIRELIATGELADGQALPSTRQLAADLAIHFNTVARAYRGLQDEGLLAIEQGRGVFVNHATRQRGRTRSGLRNELGARLREVFVDARLVGFSASQMHELVMNELQQFVRKEKKQ